MTSQLLITITPPRSSKPTVHLSSRPYKSSTSFRAASHEQKLTVFESLICGAIGRATQILSMFPIDTIKTRVQVSRITAPVVTNGVSTGTTSPLALMMTAFQQGSLYKGAAFSLLGQIPYGMLTFGVYETLLSYASPDFPQWLRVMSAAAIGDAIGSLWLTPYEVIKSKTQAGLFNTPLDAVTALSKKGFPAFYQGYVAAVARDIPFRAIQLLLFERFKTWYSTQVKTHKEISPAENLIIGAVAGTLTGALTTPLDVIRTRMMAQGVGQEALYKNALQCFITTVSTEGPVALFKGIVPRCFLLGPSSAMFFLAYETSKNFFRNRNRKSSHHVASICGRRRFQHAC